MSDEELIRDTKALLVPGEVELSGVIVHTGFSSAEEIEMNEATVEIGEVVAEVAGVGGTYVYSGNDDPAFGVNQHQGRLLADDSFVWECQQLLRDGSFDVVFYYRASLDQAELVSVLESRGYEVTSVTLDEE